MGFLETSDLAQAASLRARLKVGMTRVASSVLIENREEMNFSRAEKRYQLAVVTLRDPETRVDQFIWPVLANPAIAASGLDSSDADIEYQISLSWDLVSGVTREEITQPKMPEPEPEPPAEPVSDS